MIKIDVHKESPLKPHSPVSCVLELRAGSKSPVLDLPSRLPLQVPFGPARQPRCWDSVAARVESAFQYLGQQLTSQRERLQVLDQVYADSLVAFEQQVCDKTDTPQRMKSGRGRGHSVRWVEPTIRCQASRASWGTLARPLQWIQSWV